MIVTVQTIVQVTFGVVDDETGDMVDSKTVQAVVRRLDEESILDALGKLRSARETIATSLESDSVAKN